MYSAPCGEGVLYCTHSPRGTMTASPARTSSCPSRVLTRSIPARTSVYSSNSGVCPGSTHPDGLRILATLSDAVSVATRPMNSSIRFGLFPADSMTCGASTCLIFTTPLCFAPMKRQLAILAAILSVAIPLAAQTESNPFAAPSTLPFQAPPLDKIKDSDFQPAIEEGMRRELAEVETIASSAEPPTFANTIEAMERTGGMLRRAQRVFGALTQSNTNPTLQRIQSEEAPKLAAHRDAIYLNPKLFARVKAIYDARATRQLDAESNYLVERYYRDFVRSGALLSDADKTTLRALNKEQSQLTTEYRKRVLAATN